MTSEIIKGKCSREKKGEKMLDGLTLTKWLNIRRVTDALNATRDRDAWKVMITYAKKQST